ncbi:MAG: GMC family oxidoreductase N-terminal domain-containing protein [Verrucomicrobia bacterium]|nr:GMC family oxidoreductase N-terminal domain-containing protein [Verrucomicrobiota bacterium]
MDTWDYVVVGAGSAGCVIANRLSADPNVKVLLLEAGITDNCKWIKIPLGFLYCMGNPKIDWCFRTEKENGLNGRSIAYPRGKVLGGCSSINAMLHIRGQARDFDEWAHLTHDPSWNWEHALPLFKKSEDYYGGPSKYHGVGGEWRIERAKVRLKIVDAIRDAMVQAGIPRVDDFNRGDNEGCSPFDVAQRHGVRESSSTAFLRPIKNRPNLTILTEARATKIRFAGKRAIGIDYIRDGKYLLAKANREVILSAGAVGSPQILQVSGIGPASLLHKFGIPVVKELNGVGENLQDHLQLRMIFKVSHGPTLNDMTHSFWRRSLMQLQYSLFKTGPYSAAPSLLGAFTRSDPSYKTPNIEFHVQPLSTERPGGKLDPFPAITISPCDLRPTSRGHIRIKSPDPLDEPIIFPNYLSTDEDKQVAVDSLRWTRRIVKQPALAGYNPQEYRPGSSYQSDEELVKGAGMIGTTIFHPVGTCKMGIASDKNAVVDSSLRVFGIEGLRIADASIMPTMTSGNTYAPVMMIAEKAAEMIKEAP